MDSQLSDTPTPRRGRFGIGHGWWVVICLVYIVSPFDFVPEFLLGPIGLIDDAGIAAFAITNLVRWREQRRTRREAQQIAAGQA
jgi:uncharacterized membrane protein YkvA (DUF1232 family)